MMKGNRLIVCPRELWAKTAADHVGDAIRMALPASPGARCAVALAGGNTPGPVYAELAGRFGARIDWPRVDLFLADERMVALDHPDSNYRAAHGALLASLPASLPKIHPVATQWEPMHAAAAYELAVREGVPAHADGIPSFDLILLGVGDDGHTASIFPNSPLLSESTRLIAAIAHPRSGQERLTFTPRLLAAARQIVFLVKGEEKAHILARVYDAPPSPDLPATVVAAAAQDCVWIVDEAAAAKLQAR